MLAWRAAARLALGVIALALGAGSCTSPKREALAPVAGHAVNAAEADRNHDPGPFPVSDADPSWGDPLAPVTLVEFSDFESPFCARALATLGDVAKRFGVGKLRIVWKNNPRAFHPLARRAATFAMVRYAQGGIEAFGSAHDALFGDQAHLGEVLNALAAQSKTTLAAIEASPAWALASDKVTADVGLAERAGVTASPSFVINGIVVDGSEAAEKLATVIEAELDAAARTLGGGVSRRDLYAERSKANQRTAASDTPEASEEPEVFDVPVGASPVRGAPSALVTIVEFADFQCPFCGRAATTLRALERLYGADVRFVFKHGPLPFHARAEPAAELAEEARAQKGDQGFWAMHDELLRRGCRGAAAARDEAECGSAGGQWFDSQRHLTETDFLRYAHAVGIDANRALGAVRRSAHLAAIEADQDLADDVSAAGTPHFFINGRRLVGARPLTEFQAVIEEELQKAKALVARGIPREKIYETRLAKAASPPPPVRAVVASPTAANPSRGPEAAPVTVQLWSDYQCPYCSRVMPTLDRLERAFPNQIRLVWRNHPLPFHPNAEPAAEAAMEAFAQRGNAGFWAMSALLFDHQGDAGGLDRPALESYARQVGLDAGRFTKALDAHVHRARIEADRAEAARASLSATPSFVVNGMVVSGAQPFLRFRKTVSRALAEAAKP